MRQRGRRGGVALRRSRFSLAAVNGLLPFADAAFDAAKVRRPSSAISCWDNRFFKYIIFHCFSYLMVFFGPSCAGSAIPNVDTESITQTRFFHVRNSAVIRIFRLSIAIFSNQYFLTSLIHRSKRFQQVFQVPLVNITSFRC